MKSPLEFWAPRLLRSASMSLVQGDARDLSILGLQPGSVRCTITSPPYWELKSYAEGDKREIGRDQSKQAYLDAVGAVLAQVFELTREDGVLWLVADTLRDRSTRSAGLAEIMPLPFELADVARTIGWRFQDIVIWKKNKTLPYSGQGKLRNLIEYVLFFTRSEEFLHRPYRCAERHLPDATWLAGWPERYHPLGRRPSNVWEFGLDTQGMWSHAAGRHACPFPQALVAQCLALTTDKDDLVLDPFAGIGTVVAQAVAMGRRGVGVELNPANIVTFHEHILPEFQAEWEKQAEQRQLQREDQREEAQLIMRLRLLKAGKELLRAVQHLATTRPAGHPAAEVRSVVAQQSGGLVPAIDIDEGTIGRVTGHLLLVSDQSTSEQLLEEIRPLLGEPRFTTLGIDLDVQTVTSTELLERTAAKPLVEYGISRQGAFTAPLDAQLFDSPPALLTDIQLDTAVSGDGETELGRARLRGERQLLKAELAAGRPLPVIAQRIGVGQAALRELLVEHGFLEKPKSFSVSLPGQLTF